MNEVRDAPVYGDLGPNAIYDTIEAAKKVADRPSLMAMRLIIVRSAPDAQRLS
ncbi:hypothetical protein [Streptomyces albogriseolus]|uniref:hypothetical protein n=1 Tax=Streptomyces albogriseolus TaxID=1887 RepID=UPI003F49C4F5